MNTPIVSLREISKLFIRQLDAAERLSNLVGAKLKPQVVRAVDRVNLTIYEGEVVGLVGESGCGKSTLGRIVAGILDPTEGEIFFRGRSIRSGSASERRSTALSVQMVFQNAMASLNPRMRITDIIGQAPVRHKLIARNRANDHVAEMLSRVGLDSMLQDRYPHQLSGGQRARIGIARALAVEPKVLVCDESTAALDVSVQAQVLNLFMSLRSEFGLTYLFVSHDLGVVQLIADRVAVMYLGRIVEFASSPDLFRTPNHPYTQALLADVPQLVAKKRRYAAIKGQIPSPLDAPPGCHFHPRCPFAFDRCKFERPELAEIAPGHSSACHLNSTGVASI